MKYQIDESIQIAYKTLQGVELSEERCEQFLQLYCEGCHVLADDLSLEEQETIISDLAIKELKEYGFENLEEMYRFIKKKGL